MHWQKNIRRYIACNELFDKFVELLGDEEISLKEYNELLDAGLEEAKVGVIRQVWIRL